MQVNFSKQLKSKDSLISKSQSKHFIEQRAQQKMITNLQAGFKDEQIKHKAAENKREHIIYKAVKEANFCERKYSKLMLENEKEAKACELENKKAICHSTTKKMDHAILDRSVSNSCIV